ncbi:hypothetical protein HMPREF0946_00105 [Fusobacterium vincentii 3_1_36A2]|uniref:Uncharacterized protein n=1 Tax=Fusobacterium vincentii 3_1_36A2 TaxID=469604 RepID=C7XMT4_FUSVC|nr:hypothetical protein HMPREF0946_00105 [Fusobacterium vincentii 3_1_36A2]
MLFSMMIMEIKKMMGIVKKKANLESHKVSKLALFL